MALAPIIEVFKAWRYALLEFQLHGKVQLNLLSPTAPLKLNWCCIAKLYAQAVQLRLCCALCGGASEQLECLRACHLHQQRRCYQPRLWQQCHIMEDPAFACEVQHPEAGP